MKDIKLSVLIPMDSAQKVRDGVAALTLPHKVGEKLEPPSIIFVEEEGNEEKQKKRYRVQSYIINYGSPVTGLMLLEVVATPLGSHEE